MKDMDSRLKGKKSTYLPKDNKFLISESSGNSTVPPIDPRLKFLLWRMRCFPTLFFKVNFDSK